MQNRPKQAGRLTTYRAPQPKTQGTTHSLTFSPIDLFRHSHLSMARMRQLEKMKLKHVRQVAEWIKGKIASSDQETRCSAIRAAAEMQRYARLRATMEGQRAVHN